MCSPLFVKANSKKNRLRNFEAYLLITPYEDGAHGGRHCPCALGAQCVACALALPNPQALEEVPCVRA